MKNYLFIFAVFLILFNSCVKKECRNFVGAYNFEIPATLSPARDTYQVGDTIKFISMFADQVYETKTDRYYKLTDFMFFPNLRIREISDTVWNEAALSSFEMIVNDSFNFSEFNYSDGAISYIGQYNYESGNYTLAYMLIPRAAGFFHFSHSCSLVKLGEDQDFDGKCKNISSDVVVKLNDGADNNIEMLNDSPDPHYNDWILQKPEERFHKFGGYCFYVK